MDLPRSSAEVVTTASRRSQVIVLFKSVYVVDAQDLLHDIPENYSYLLLGSKSTRSLAANV